VENQQQYLDSQKPLVFSFSFQLLPLSAAYKSLLTDYQVS